MGTWEPSETLAGGMSAVVVLPVLLLPTMLLISRHAVPAPLPLRPYRLRWPALIAMTDEGPLIRVLPWAGHREPSALLVAEGAESGEELGQCGLQVLDLTPGGIGAQQATDDQAPLLCARPLLSGLNVLPQHRRRGVATRLVARAESLAADWGYAEIVLQVDKRNENAIALYERLDYVVVRPTAQERSGRDLGTRLLELFEQFGAPVQQSMRKELEPPERRG